MSLQSVADTLQPLYVIFEPVIPVAILAIGGIGISILQKHGYSTTYANALLRAAGVGIQAAKTANVDPLSAAGRSIATSAGAAYLMDTVGTSAAKLGITTIADHATRVSAQIDSMTSTAGLTASASAAVAAPVAAVAAPLVSDLAGVAAPVAAEVTSAAATTGTLPVAPVAPVTLMPVAKS